MLIDLIIHRYLFVCLFVSWPNSSQWARASSFVRFIDHTQTHHSRQESSGRVISSSQRLLPYNTQHSQQKNIQAPGGIRIHDLSRREAADIRLRQRDHWDRHSQVFSRLKTKISQSFIYYINFQLVHRSTKTSQLTSYREITAVFLAQHVTLKSNPSE